MEGWVLSLIGEGGCTAHAKIKCKDYLYYTPQSLTGACGFTALTHTQGQVTERVIVLHVDT